MNEQLSNPASPATWDVLKSLRISLNPAVELDVQSFRSQHWYVLTEQESGESFRVSDSLKFIFDSRSADLNVGAALALETPHADDNLKEQIALALVQLYRSHLIELSPIDQIPEQLKQLRAQHKTQKKRFNPLSIRVPLWDPDKFLTRTKPVSDLLFHPIVLFSMIAVALSGLGVGLAHMGEIQSDALSQLETPGHWWLFVVAYIALKIVHESAHGFAVKRWNGHVHDMGVMLLVLFPVPYVDATASNMFKDKYQRIGVASAGIIAEALCAGIGVFAWLAMEPGALRTFAFDVILIGGVSTLLFNGNPLMRFDAYYVLADWIEIPNLFARSRKYVDYCLIHYLLGDREMEAPGASRSEKAWLFSYGVSSSVYRLFIMLGITTYLVNTFFFIGVMLALWVAFAQLILPVWRFSAQLRRSDKNSQRKFGLLARFACYASALFLFLSFVPVPQTTVAHGIVTVEDDAHIRAKVGGFVTESTILPRQRVNAGEVVAKLSNPELMRDKRFTQAAIKAVRSEINAAHLDGVEVGIIKESLRAYTQELAEIETRVTNLAITSANSGAFVAASAKPIQDRYVQKGETIGYVVEPSHLIVRLALTEADLALVQDGVREIELKVMSEHGRSYAAELLRVVPSALSQLPSKALGTQADGSIAVDPADEDGLRPLENVFQVDIKTLEPMHAVNVATRAYARFVHVYEPLLPRVYRATRRLFLSRFSV